MKYGLFCIILFFCVCGAAVSYGMPTIKSFKRHLNGSKNTVRGYKRSLRTDRRYNDKNLTSNVLDQVEKAFIASRISLDLDFFAESLHLLVEEKDKLPKNEDMKTQINKAKKTLINVKAMSTSFKKLTSTVPAMWFEKGTSNYTEKTMSQQSIMTAEFRLLATFEPFVKCLVKNMRRKEIKKESTKFDLQTLRLLEMCSCQIGPCLKKTENTDIHVDNTEEKKKSRKGKPKKNRKLNKNRERRRKKPKKGRKRKTGQDRKQRIKQN